MSQGHKDVANCGRKDIWRIRIGAYRVIYSIDDATKTVSILRIAHRREVYD